MSTDHVDNRSCCLYSKSRDHFLCMYMCAYKQGTPEIPLMLSDCPLQGASAFRQLTMEAPMPYYSFSNKISHNHGPVNTMDPLGQDMTKGQFLSGV